MKSDICKNVHFIAVPKLWVAGEDVVGPKMINQFFKNLLIVSAVKMQGTQYVISFKDIAKKIN